MRQSTLPAKDAINVSRSMSASDFSGVRTPVSSAPTQCSNRSRGPSMRRCKASIDASFEASPVTAMTDALSNACGLRDKV
jgi:hypothetical protein